MRIIALLLTSVSLLGLIPAGTCAEASGDPACCAKPPIRPIDKTCLPAGKSPATIPLYRGDLQAKYAEIANIDSFVSLDECDDTVRLQLKDLQTKARAIGADAAIRVRKLNNRIRGFQEDPETPFWSVKQGYSKDRFLRATAIKYLEIPPAEPRQAVTELPVINRDQKAPVNPMGAQSIFDKANRERPVQNVTLPEAVIPKSY